MQAVLGILAAALISSAAVQPVRPAARPDDRVYQTLRQELDDARAAATLSAVPRRLLLRPDVRPTPALRSFITGYTAFLAYDRSAAERDLTRSFRLASSPHAAAALAANAVEMGLADSAMTWTARGLDALIVAPNPALEVELRLMRAQALAWSVRYAERATETRRALDIARTTADPRALASALRAHAHVLADAGESGQAVDTFREAIRVSEESADAAALGYHLLIATSRPDASVEAKLPQLDRALQLAHDIRDRQLEGRVRGARGAVQLLLKQYDAALQDLTAADSVLRVTGAARSRAAVNGNLGLLFTELGNYDRAEQYTSVSTELYRQVGNQHGVRTTLDGLGTLAMLRGDPALAVARHERVVAQTRTWGDKEYLREALVRLGLAGLARGHFEPAERHIREALSIEVPGRPMDGLASAHAALGDALRLTGRATDARREYLQALEMAPRTARTPTLTVRAHHGLGMLEASAGRPGAALAHYRIALAQIERERAAARQPDLQLTYFSQKSVLYVDAIEALVAAHSQTGSGVYLGEALAFAERAKARTLLDAVADRDAKPASDDPQSTIADLASALEPSDLFVEFVAGPSQSFAFTLRHDSTITVHQLPPRAALEKQIRAFREKVTRRPAFDAGLDDVRRSGSRLYAALLAQALGSAADATRLIVVADGLLFYTPFEALTIAGTREFVGERFEVVRAASGSVLSAIRARRPSAAATAARFVGFGDPHVTGAAQPAAQLVRALEHDGFSFAPLPGSRREVEASAAAFRTAGARIYTGKAFTAKSVLAELQRPNRIVHFATHAVLDERVPDRSGIVLSTQTANGAPAILRARDVAGLRIPVDLVALSACQTGLGRIVAGEGVLGLAWAFARAGVGSLMVTLWSVSDAASTSTMVAFYQALVAGQPKAAALRTARLKTIRGANPALRHPYYWAGYVLIGDPD